MSIKEMLLLAGMALAAIAFAAPAVAQAKVELTDPANTTLPVGSQVTVTTTNLKSTTAAGTTECAKVTLHYALVTNGPNHVVLNPVGAHNATPETCVLNTGAVKHTVHVTNFGTGQVTINTWGTAVTAATLTMNITGPGLHCTYTGNVHLQAVTSGTDDVKVGPSPLAGAPAPPCPGATFHGDATLETPNGAAVTLDFAKTG